MSLEDIRENVEFIRFQRDKGKQRSRMELTQAAVGPLREYREAGCRNVKRRLKLGPVDCRRDLLWDQQQANKQVSVLPSPFIHSKSSVLA